MADSVDALARKIARLEKQINRISRKGQLAYSSFEGGAISEFDPETEDLVQLIGMQFDGTHTVAQFNGPPPPVPAAPDLEALAGVVRVSWDGEFERTAAGDPQYAPMDFARVEVHMSTSPDFDTNLTTTLMTTFDTARGGSKDIAIREPGTQHVRLLSRSTSGKRSADSEQVSIEADWERLEPPTTTPTALVVGSIGSLQVLWPVTQNPSSYDVEVHILDDDTVPTLGDPATLSTVTRGTMAVITEMPDGTPLDPALQYRVWLIALNAQGAAPAQGPFLGSLRQVDTADISVSAAWVGTMSVDQLTGGILQGETIVGSGGGIYAEGSNGEKVGLWPTGFRVSGGASVNFRTYVDFPTNGAPNIISGVLRATTLEVEGDPVTGRAMSLRGRSELAQGAELRMATAITPPIAGPVVTDFYPTAQIDWNGQPAPSSWSALRGGFWDNAANLYYFIDGVGLRVYWMTPLGVVQGSQSIADRLMWTAASSRPTAYGITRAGGRWHILHFGFWNNYPYATVSRLEVGTWAFTGAWFPHHLTYSTVRFSGIGVDGSGHVVIAGRRAADDDLVAISFPHDVPDYQNGSRHGIETKISAYGAGAWDNNGPIRSIEAMPSDLPSGRWVIAQTGRAIVLTSSGRDTANEFPLESDVSAGVWWKGAGSTGSFYSVSLTGSVTQYSSIRATAGRAHFAHTRYNAVGGYETEISPITSHDVLPRAWIKATAAYPGATGARLYGIISTATPSRTSLVLQDTFETPNDTRIFGAPLASTGSLPPLATDRPFPNASPSQIVSTDGSTYWRGDGTAKFREAILFSSRDVTALSGNTPALRTGDPSAGHIRYDGNQIQSMSNDDTAKPLYLNIETDAHGGTGSLVLGQGSRAFRCIRAGSTSVTADANGQDTIAHNGPARAPDLVVATKKRAGANGAVEVGGYNATTFTVTMTGHSGTLFSAGDSTTVDWIAIWF